MAQKMSILAKAFPPGAFIREELEERGWTQHDLAARMGRPLQTVNMIVNGHKAITAETAYQLEKVFGQSAIYWMNLESTWQLYKWAEIQKETRKRRLPAPIVSAPSASGRMVSKAPKRWPSALGFRSLKGGAPEGMITDSLPSPEKASPKSAKKPKRRQPIDEHKRAKAPTRGKASPRQK